MPRIPERENPFQPGAGTLPPVLAGRGAELLLATRRLDLLQRGQRPSRGLMFFGPRGNGKTTLLTRIATDAIGLGMRAESIPAAIFGDDRKLVRWLQEKTGLTGPQVRSVSAAGFGLADPGSPTEDVNELLSRWIGAADTPLLMLLDEAHTVEPEAGRVFFTALQEAAGKQLGFALLAAGTPDAPRRLRRAGTFTERALERVPIGRLGRAETLHALIEPARTSGLPMQEPAAAFLAAGSQDYPYFIQLLGRAAWECADAAGADGIGLAEARAGASATRPEMERFYAERFGEACERRLGPFLPSLAASFREDGGRVTELRFRGLLHRLATGASPPADETALLNELTDLGIVWQATPGTWELGIPSFGDYLLRLGEEDPRPGG